MAHLSWLNKGARFKRREKTPKFLSLNYDHFISLGTETKPGLFIKQFPRVWWCYRDIFLPRAVP